MDVEQAMAYAEWAKSVGSVDLMAKPVRAVVTLAAEVRRLQGAVPAGCVRDDKGVDRQVVGPLPITRDGVVVCVGCEVFHPQQDQAFHLSVMAHDGGEDTEEFPIPNDCEYVGHYSYWEGDTGYSTYETYDIRQCYSTRAAAEAARERGPT